MDIGGKDVIVHVSDTPELRAFVERYLRSVWPALVLEVDPMDPTELFYHQDIAAMKSWDLVGLSDFNHDTMVHVIYERDMLTLVVSHAPGAKTAKMAAELEQNIRANFHIFGVKAVALTYAAETGKLLLRRELPGGLSDEEESKAGDALDTLWWQMSDEEHAAVERALANLVPHEKNK